MVNSAAALCKKHARSLLNHQTCLLILLFLLTIITVKEVYDQNIDEIYIFESTLEKHVEPNVQKNIPAITEAKQASKIQKQSEVFLPRNSSNRYLLFSSVGKQCLDTIANLWLRNTSTFDIVLIYYRSIEDSTYASLKDMQRNLTHNMIVINHMGYKWVNFRWWLSQVGVDTVSQRYKGIWVPDDDIEMDTESINKFFSLLDRYPNILFASPSFSKDSIGCCRFFDRQDLDFILRYGNFVENSCAFIQTKLLLYDNWFKKCLQAVNTGYYFDFCFFPATNYSKTAMATIDEVVATHRKRTKERPSELVETYSGTTKGHTHREHKADWKFFKAQGVPASIYTYRALTHFEKLRKTL